MFSWMGDGLKFTKKRNRPKSRATKSPPTMARRRDEKWVWKERADEARAGTCCDFCFRWSCSAAGTGAEPVGNFYQERDDFYGDAREHRARKYSDSRRENRRGRSGFEGARWRGGDRCHGTIRDSRDHRLPLAHRGGWQRE